MSRRAALAHVADEVFFDHPPAPVYPDDLEGAIQNALSCLADLDMRYDEERDRLATWNGPPETKLKLGVELAQLHQRDREPYVQLLGELHRRISALSLFGARRSTH